MTAKINLDVMQIASYDILLEIEAMDTTKSQLGNFYLDTKRLLLL